MAVEALTGISLSSWSLALRGVLLPDVFDHFGGSRIFCSGRHLGNDGSDDVHRSRGIHRSKRRSCRLPSARGLVGGGFDSQALGRGRLKKAGQSLSLWTAHGEDGQVLVSWRLDRRRALRCIATRLGSDGFTEENGIGRDDFCQTSIDWQEFENLETDLPVSPSQVVQEGVDMLWSIYETDSSDAHQVVEGEYEWPSPGYLALDSGPVILGESRFREISSISDGGAFNRVDASISNRPRSASWADVGSAEGNPVRLTSPPQASVSRTAAQSRFARLKGELSPKLAEQVEGLSIPPSLRSLKKRNGRGGKGGEAAACCAMKKAFDSIVYMIRALQSYTIQMRQVFTSNVDFEQIASLVHTELQSSFLWLFQQVFSRTPILMVSVMILLANFTVFSMGNNVAMANTTASPTHIVSILQKYGETKGAPFAGADGRKAFSLVGKTGSPEDYRVSSTLLSHADPEPLYVEHCFGNYGSGNSGKLVQVAGEEDSNQRFSGVSQRSSMFSVRDSTLLTPAYGSSCTGRGLPLPSDSLRKASSTASEPPRVARYSRFEDQMAQFPLRNRMWFGSMDERSEEVSFRFLFEETLSELELRGGESLQHLVLDQETIGRLVAPVSAKLEPDDYLCFDRTDLEYQHAIRGEPTNPLLLANYAQFLYAVRHDNNRAEDFFNLALEVDSEDGDTLGRYAIFLWLARKDKLKAEAAYRAAIASDPSNPFHSGSYAHFLWHFGEEEAVACHL